MAFSSTPMRGLALLARSRYMFIAQHRGRFGDVVIADLRGWVEHGSSPFWEAVAGPFFGSGFLEADLHNAVHGNQFIADLMPRYPIYTSMLPAAARAAIGRPHDEGYCDIFDAGPTVQARTDQIRTVRESRPVEASLPTLVSDDAQPLVAQGRESEFRVWQVAAAR